MKRVSLLLLLAVLVLGLGTRAEASGGTAPAPASAHRCACGPGCPGGSKCCCARPRTTEHRKTPARVATRPAPARVVRACLRETPCPPFGSPPSADRVERDRAPVLAVAGARRPRRQPGGRVAVPEALDHASLPAAPPDRPPERPRLA